MKVLNFGSLNLDHRITSYNVCYTKLLRINTGLPVAEEFPRFTRFWIDQPAPGSETITVWAALESASLTGAYQFVITPGEETVMDVTARLFFRVV